MDLVKITVKDAGNCEIGTFTLKVENDTDFVIALKSLLKITLVDGWTY